MKIGIKGVKMKMEVVERIPEPNEKTKSNLHTKYQAVLNRAFALKGNKAVKLSFRYMPEASRAREAIYAIVTRNKLPLTVNLRGRYVFLSKKWKK